MHLVVSISVEVLKRVCSNITFLQSILLFSFDSPFVCIYIYNHVSVLHLCGTICYEMDMHSSNPAGRTTSTCQLVKYRKRHYDACHCPQDHRQPHRVGLVAEEPFTLPMRVTGNCQIMWSELGCAHLLRHHCVPTTVTTTTQGYCNILCNIFINGFQ